jgi:hypothetical protein
MKIRHTGPRPSGKIPGTDIIWTRGVPVDVPDGIAQALLAGGHTSDGGEPVAPEWEKVATPAPKPTTKTEE